MVEKEKRAREWMKRRKGGGDGKEKRVWERREWEKGW